MKHFKIAVTVTHKKHKTLPIWDSVHMWLDGDASDLQNLLTQLELVKQDVNHDMNKKGFALRDVDVKIDFIPVKNV